MKRYIMFVLIVIVFAQNKNLFAQNDDAILLTIDDRNITKGEFERIYRKNNNSIDPKSVNEYLELFVNFKLKVIEAENLGMDTLPSFLNELNGYRKQLANPYLTKKEFEEALFQEAYQRTLKEVNANHIMLRVNFAKASRKDTLEAYNKLIEIRERALSGESFSDLAKEFSDDAHTKQYGGRLGYFVAYRMVYPFETAAFTTEIGDISLPVRSFYGYHIVKVNDLRESRGEVKVGHIMVAVPRGSADSVYATAKIKADEYYQMLQDGADFGEIAQKYSDDKNSARNNGEMDWFGAGRMIPDFEEAAFGIENIGDYIEPFRTTFGYHIIKLIDRRPVKSYEELLPKFQNNFARDDYRKEAVKKATANKFRANYKIVENKDQIQKMLATMDEEFFNTGVYTQEENLEKELFSIEETSYTLQDFIDYLKNNRKFDHGSWLFLEIRFEDYVNSMIIDYEDKHLEEKYADFRNLMNEYHDGILLFDLTDKLVWSKAIKDTTGLKNFYEENKENYKWENRVSASIYKCDSKEKAIIARKLVKAQTKKGYSKDQIIELTCNDSLNNCLNIQSGVFEKEDNDWVDTTKWKSGVSKLYENDGKYLFVNIDAHIEPVIKTLDEARGLVTADYQNYLEKLWIEELREKYTVSVDEEVLKTVE